MRQPIATDRDGSWPDEGGPTDCGPAVGAGTAVGRIDVLRILLESKLQFQWCATLDRTPLGVVWLGKLQFGVSHLDRVRQAQVVATETATRIRDGATQGSGFSVRCVPPCSIPAGRSVAGTWTRCECGVRAGRSQAKRAVPHGLPLFHHEPIEPRPVHDPGHSQVCAS